MPLVCDDFGECYDDGTGDGGDTTTIDWVYNEDGTMTDPSTGNIFDTDGQLVGNTADAGQGGGSVVYDPDQFGDVYTVNGQWVGNINGESDPAQNPGSGRGPQAGGGGGGGNQGGGGGGNQNQSLAQLIQQLQQLLSAAKSNNGSAQQQAALAAALRNAQAKQASAASTKTILIAGGALLALLAFSRR